MGFFESPAGMVVLLVYLSLLALGIWSLILWKKTQTKRRLMYLIGAIILLLLFLVMTAVFLMSMFSFT